MDVGKQMRAGAAMGVFGDLISEAVRVRAKDFFTFTLDYLPLAASATQTATFAVDSDSDFMLCALAGLANVNATPATQVPFVHALVTLADTGSGRLFQSSAVHFNNLFGSGQFPGYLPYPKLIPRASAVRCTLQNLVATAIEVRLTFSGFKVFPMKEAV